MGGGGGGSNTTNTVAEPWKGQQPYLKDVFSQAQGLYNAGGLAPEYYSGNTVAGQSDWTTQANQMQADRALNGSASISTAQGAMDNITSGNALAGNTGLNQLNALAGTNFNAGNAGLDMTLNAGNAALNNSGLTQMNALAGQDVNAGNAGLDVLNQMTSAVNPYSSALLNDAVGQAGAQIDSGFSSAGRYGSGAHENAKADSIADLTSQFYSDAYNKQMDAANAASQSYLSGAGLNSQNAQAAGNLYNSALQTQLGAGQAAGNLYNSGYGLQLDAAGQAGNLYDTGLNTQISGAGMSQELANQAYKDAEALSQAGANLDAYNQALIDAEIDRYNYNSQIPLTALSNYNQLIQGTYGGTSTSTGKQNYSPNALGTAVGGAATSIGLMDSLLGGDWSGIF